MTQFVEIRTYNLKPGTRAEFHRLVVEQSLLYFLFRAYTSLEDRERSQEAFYGSDEWRRGPRQAIVDCIENDASVVIENGYRHDRPAPPIDLSTVQGVTVHQDAPCGKDCG